VASSLAIEAVGLFKSFDGKPAVRGIDIAVPQGTIYGILGPNGAGKTTTLRMLLGIIEPDSGSRTLLGHARPLEAAKIVGYLPEERGLYPSMKAYDAIAFMGALRGVPLAVGRKRGRELLEANGLPPDRQIRQLSKGMAQQVQLLGTLVHEPRLVILDEPFSGLDVSAARVLKAFVRSLAGEGKMVVFSSHVLEVVEQVCTRVVILKDGHIVGHDSVENLRNTLKLPSLDAVFATLVEEDDVDTRSAALVAAMHLQ
jgi:ABC-2 type transport system ATP-binding protein